MATSPTFSSGVSPIRAKITAALTTDPVDVYDNTLGTKAVRIEGLSMASDDDAAKNVLFSMWTAGPITYPISAVPVPALSGTTGTVARVNALPSIGVLAPDGIYDVWIGAGEKLQANAVATLTSAKTITITGRVRLYV